VSGRELVQAAIAGELWNELSIGILLRPPSTGNEQRNNENINSNQCLG